MKCVLLPKPSARSASSAARPKEKENNQEEEEEEEEKEERATKLDRTVARAANFSCALTMRFRKTIFAVQIKQVTQKYQAFLETTAVEEIPQLEQELKTLQEQESVLQKIVSIQSDNLDSTSAR